MATNLAHLCLAKIQQRLTIEFNAAAELGVCRQQLQNTQGGNGFARAGLTDQTNRFAGVDGKRDPFNRLNAPLTLGEADFEIVNCQ